MARNRYDMDEILEESFDVNQLKRLAAYIAPYKKKMAGVVVLMLTSSALTMAIPIFLQNVMDYSIPRKDMKSIVFYSALTLVIALYSGFALRMKIKTMSAIGQHIVHAIRYDIFSHLQEYAMSDCYPFYDPEQTIAMIYGLPLLTPGIRQTANFSSCFLKICPQNGLYLLIVWL